MFVSYSYDVKLSTSFGIFPNSHALHCTGTVIQLFSRLAFQSIRTNTLCPEIYHLFFHVYREVVTAIMEHLDEWNLRIAALEIRLMYLRLHNNEVQVRTIFN